MIDYYGVLKLDKGATHSEIKFAYKKLIHKYHPDISKESDSVKKFKMVLKAYKVLEDPTSRLEYDKKYTNYFPKKSEKNRSNILENSDDWIPKKSIKFLFKEVFNKKKLDKVFKNIKKARADLRRKRFIEREQSKIRVDSNLDLYNKLSEIELKARLKSSANHYVRAHTAKIIGKRKEKKFFFELIKSLSDVSPIVRKEVIKAIGNIKDYRAINFLVNSIYDYDDSVRLELAIVLRNFSDTRIVSALIKLLEDRDEKVVIEAIYSLGVIGDSDVANHIRKKLAKSSLKVRRAALEVIRILR